MPAILTPPERQRIQEIRDPTGSRCAGDLGEDSGAAPGWALHRQPSVERADAVGEAAQTGTAVGRGAAGAVVADLDASVAVLAADCDPGLARVCVLGDVRQ